MLDTHPNPQVPGPWMARRSPLGWCLKRAQEKSHILATPEKQVLLFSSVLHA